MSSDYEVIKEIKKQMGIEFERVSRDSFDDFSYEGVLNYINRNYTNNQIIKKHLFIEKKNKIIGFYNSEIAINIDLVVQLKDLQLLIIKW